MKLCHTFACNVIDISTIKCKNRKLSAQNFKVNVAIMLSQPPRLGDKLYIVINNFLELSEVKNYYNQQYTKKISIAYLQQQIQNYRDKYDDWKYDKEIILSDQALMDELSNIPWIYKISNEQYLIHFEIDDLCLESVACTNQNCKKLHFYNRLSICGHYPDKCQHQNCGRYHVWETSFRDKVASILLAFGENNMINLVFFKTKYDEFFPYQFYDIILNQNNFYRIWINNLKNYNQCGNDILWTVFDDYIKFDTSKIINNICSDHVHLSEGCHAGRYRSFKHTYRSENHKKFAQYHPTLCHGIHISKLLKYDFSFASTKKTLLTTGNSLNLLYPYLYHWLTTDRNFRENTYKPIILNDADLKIMQRLEQSFQDQFVETMQTLRPNTNHTKTLQGIDIIHHMDKIIDNGFHDGQNLNIIKGNYYQENKPLLPCIESTIAMFQQASEFCNVDLRPIDVSIRNLNKNINLYYKVNNYNNNILSSKSMADDINRKYAFGRAASIQSQVIAYNDDGSVTVLFQIADVNFMVSQYMMQTWFEDIIINFKQFFEQYIMQLNGINFSDFQLVKSNVFWTIPLHYQKSIVFSKKHQIIEYHVRNIDQNHINWMNRRFDNTIHFSNCNRKRNKIYALKLDTKRFLHSIPPIIIDDDQWMKKHFRNNNNDEQKMVKQVQGKMSNKKSISKKIDESMKKRRVDKISNKIEGCLFKYDAQGNANKLWFTLNGAQLWYGLDKINVNGYRIINIKFKNAQFALELIPPQSCSMIRFIVTPDLELSIEDQQKISNYWKIVLRGTAKAKQIMINNDHKDIINNNFAKHKVINTAKQLICDNNNKGIAINHDLAEQKVINDDHKHTINNEFAEHKVITDAEHLICDNNNNKGIKKKNMIDNKGIVRCDHQGISINELTYWINLKHEQCAKRSRENDARCGPELPIEICRYCLNEAWSEEHARNCLFMPTWVQESGAYNDY